MGLVLTFVALALMRAGQPALLYLVPCTLLTVLLLAWRRGDLGAMWAGDKVRVCVRVWCVYACTLLTVLLFAWRRGDLGAMWAGDKGRVCACVVRVCMYPADGAAAGVAPQRPGHHVGGGQGAYMCVCGACMRARC